MLVAYCAECLPQKVVLGYNDRICELRTPHRAHPQTKKLGYFPISYNGWRQVFVEGDDAQTKENIIAQFGNEFV
jgi:hypothetical protein